MHGDPEEMPAKCLVSFENFELWLLQFEHVCLQVSSYSQTQNHKHLKYV